ncbi:MAG: hypothetical protein ACM3TU_00945 [Bacillota bacterium]
MRRILFIIAGIIVFLGIGIGVYLLLSHKSSGLAIGGGNEFPSAEQGGLSDGSTTQAAQGLGVPVPGAGTDIAPGLVRITDRPVALGSIAVYVPPQVAPATTTASSTSVGSTEPDVRVEYVERESGNIYAYLAHARTLTRLSNKTLPGIQEATWMADGSLAYVRFLEKTDGAERIDTYALPSDGGNGYFLEQNLSQVLTRATSTLVTLLSTTDGSSASISSPSGSNLKTLFSSPLSSLRLGFLGANLVATTKASAKTDGYAFVVDGKTGVFTRALGPLSGLATLPSPQGKYIAFSYLDHGQPALAVLTISTHVATRLPLSTLAEKCAWTNDDSALYCGVPSSLPKATLPDDWYQGATAFSDRIWRIDLAGRVATLVIDPKQAGGVDVDAVGLALDRTNDVLIFTNKRDEALYALDI